MKSTILFLLTICCFLTSSAQRKSQQTVLQSSENLRLAMIDGNKEKLEAIVSDSLSYGHSGGLVEGKKEFVEKISSGKSDFVTIEISNRTISISKKVAVERHELSATTNDSGKPGTVHLRILLLWQKQKGKWVLLARQAVKFI